MKKRADVFVFTSYKADFSKGKVDFYFEIKRDKEILKFCERITFLPVSLEHIKTNEALLYRVLENLFLILGISYWKLYCPKTIEILPFTLSKKEAIFWNTVYTKGLGEFFYKNNIDFKNLIRFPYGNNIERKVFKFGAKKRQLLLFGGGKDSIVAAEILKKEKKNFLLYSLGESSIQKDVAMLAGKEMIVINRMIDPQLFMLNEKGDVYNGHVPVSAIYAFSGIFASTLYGFSQVVASNEKSANYGNVKWHGSVINHQWSKSKEFEKLLQNYLTNFVTRDIHYYSILRSLTELEIVKEFVRYPKYFSSFSSCNRNFRITKKTKKKWCGECPKCAFVFVTLAAYLPKDYVVRIFGKNLFGNKKLISLYEELLGLRKFKPFECVGTPEETKKAIRLIAKKGEYKKDTVMRHFEISVNKKQ